MDPLKLAPEQLALALSILGPNLDHWATAVEAGFLRVPRDGEVYDRLVCGPILKEGKILIGRRHVDRLLVALNDIELASKGKPEYLRVSDALSPIWKEIERVGKPA